MIREREHPGLPSRKSPPDDRERDLIAGTEAGDRAATEELVQEFMPAIGGVAYLYRSFANIDQLELRQEGVVGLLRAAKRYDRTVGTPFWAYASWWVRQAMQRLVAELSGPVVLSDRAARRLVQLKRARNEYQQRNGREPSLGELADTADLSRHQVENLIAVERAPRQLDARVPGENETSAAFADGLTDPSADDAYERIDDLIEVEHLPDLTEGLDERERKVVFAHYGIGGPRRTLREIGDGLHLSVERVRQLEERALQKLREAAAWSPAVGHN